MNFRHEFIDSSEDAARARMLSNVAALSAVLHELGITTERLDEELNPTGIIPADAPPPARRAPIDPQTGAYIITDAFPPRTA